MPPCQVGAVTLGARGSCATPARPADWIGIAIEVSVRPSSRHFNDLQVEITQQLDEAGSRHGL
eukprot:16387346-Heterocapsa_arctica.AAC.1